MILVTTLIVVAFSEWLLSLFFINWYFQFGIPVFVYRSKLFNSENGIPEAKQIQNSIINSDYANIVVKKIGDSTFGFRESYAPNYFKWNYTPVIRGFMFIDTEKKQIEVMGLLNFYSLLWLILMGTYIYYGESMLKIFGFFGIIMCIGIFVTQYNRYKHVARIAGENPQN